MLFTCSSDEVNLILCPFCRFGTKAHVKMLLKVPRDEQCGWDSTPRLPKPIKLTLALLHNPKAAHTRKPFKELADIPSTISKRIPFLLSPPKFPQT